MLDLDYDEQIYAWFDLWLKGAQESDFKKTLHLECSIIQWAQTSGNRQTLGPHQMYR